MFEDKAYEAYIHFLRECYFNFHWVWLALVGLTIIFITYKLIKFFNKKRKFF